MPKSKSVTAIAILSLVIAFLPCGAAFSLIIGGNDPPVISSVTANPNPASPGGRSGLTCIASDPDGAITYYEWWADGGAFPNGTTSQTLTAPTNTIEWSAPAETGYYNIAVTVYDDGGGPETQPATAIEYLAIYVDGQNNSPTITSLIPEADSVLLGTSIFVTVSAIDPDSNPLSYTWSASGGTITGDNDVDPETIIWTAPLSVRDCTITATVTDGRGGQAQQSVVVTAGIAYEVGYIRTAGANPVRITTDTLGHIYVSDTGRDRILIYDEFGDYIGGIFRLGGPLGLAAGPGGRLYIGEDDSDRVSIYNTSGTLLGTFGGPTVEMPNSIDVDAALDRVFVVDSAGALVLVYDTNGIFQYSIDGSAAVAGGFIFPVGVSVDAATSTIYVTDAGTYQVHGLDYAGNSRVNFGGMGNGAGLFTRPQGVGVDGEGRIFAVDSYQSRVQVFDSTGTYLATVGSFGSDNGELSIPMDAHIDRFDRLLVTSNDNSRIEVFSLTDRAIPLPNQPPAAPWAHLPANGVEVATLNPELTVLAAVDPDDDPLNYEFEVVEQGWIDVHGSISGVPEAQGQATWTVQPSLSENTFYEWHARASDGIGTGPWTPTRLFFVNIANDTPAAPEELLTPNGADMRPYDALQWAGSVDPDALDIISYVLEIDDDWDFSSILIREENIPGTSITLESLTQYDLLVDDTDYYWRVMGVDNHGAESDWAWGWFYFNRVEIEITSSPAGARAFIDGSPAYPGWSAGESPTIAVNVAEGFHIVTLIKEGYEPYTSVVDNHLGVDAQVTAQLIPTVQEVLIPPRAIPIYRIIGTNVMHSRPFIIDWNFDGGGDVLVGDDSGSVHLILRGTMPPYQGVLLDTAAVFGFSAREVNVFAVDWDNDSDFDLLIGTRSDGLLLALNTGDQQTASFVDGGKITIQGLDPLSFATSLAPAVLDWNDDGLKDLIVAGSSGIVGLYINSGTDEAPQFAVEEYLYADGEPMVVPFGYAVPFVTDWDKDGLDDLLFGTGEGPIYLYRNVGSRSAPAYTSAGPIQHYTSLTTQVDVNPGPRSIPYLADWNGDGLRELFCGNQDGYIVLYRGVRLP